VDNHRESVENHARLWTYPADSGGRRALRGGRKLGLAADSGGDRSVVPRASRVPSPIRRPPSTGSAGSSTARFRTAHARCPRGPHHDDGDDGV